MSCTFTLRFDAGAKVRISEHNTKQKAIFLFLLSNKSTFEHRSEVRISAEKTNYFRPKNKSGTYNLLF